MTTTNEEKMIVVIDLMGEHHHNTFQGVLKGFRENGLLSEAGLHQADFVETLSYGNLTPEYKEQIRATMRVLLMEILKGCVE